MMKIIKRFLGKLILIVLGIGTVTMAMEIIARVVPKEKLPGSLPIIVQAMQLGTAVLYIRDPYFRYITGPYLNVKIEHPDFTYRVVTKLNFERAGFRGGTLGGSVWGIALGDSTTFGMGVEHEATWVAQLAKFAQREVVNLGVPGWGPPQYTRALERYGIPLRPKIVIYAIYRNDLHDALVFERWLKDRTFSYRLSNFLARHSVAYNVFGLMAASGWEKKRNDLYLDELEVGFDSAGVARALSEDRRFFNAGWPLVEREIERAIQYSDRINARFLLLHVPSKEEAYWHLIRQKNPALKPLDDALEMMRKSTEQFCKIRNVSCVDPTRLLRTHAAQGEKFYFTSDTHANENGHKLIAQAIYRAMLESKIP